MRKCEKCGAELAEDAVFCHECGARAARTAVCAKCGKELRAGAKFCDGCGTPVQAEDDEIQEAIKGGEIKVSVDGKELTHEEVMDVYEKGGRFDVEADSLETKIDKIISSLPAEDQKFIREYKVFPTVEIKKEITDKIINNITRGKPIESAFPTYRRAAERMLKELETIDQFTMKDVIIYFINEGIGLAYIDNYDLKDVVLAVINRLRDKNSKEYFHHIYDMLEKNNMCSSANHIIFTFLPSY